MNHLFNALLLEHMLKINIYYFVIGNKNVDFFIFLKKDSLIYGCAREIKNNET